MARRLSNEASLEELSELSRFFEEYPHAKQIADIIDEVCKNGEVGVESVQDERFELLLDSLRKETPKHNKVKLLHTSRVWWYGAAAAVILILTVFSFVIFNTPKIKKTELTAQKLETPKGGRKQLILPDGTKAWLNAGSSLTLVKGFNNLSREVELTGEAYFDVVKNRDKPFIVHTSGLDIKVVGTVFNIKDYENDPVIEATLLRGIIEVVNRNNPNTASVVLKPNEKLTFEKTVYTQATPKKLLSKPVTNNAKPGITIIPLTASVDETVRPEVAWVYNQLVFEDEGFEAIVQKMERWYNVKINMTDQKLSGYTLSGSFKNETVNEALDVLQQLAPFSYTIKNNEITLYSKQKRN